MPGDSDVLFGLRNTIVVAVVLLFISGVLALFSGLVGITYPGNAISNICLWAALVIGSVITTQNKYSGSGNAWMLGLSLGLVYSALVVMLTMIVQKVAQVEAQNLGQILLIVPFYAVLGLAGSVAGSVFSSGSRQAKY